MKFLVPVLVLFLLTGCMERPIYSEISDNGRIGHPPARVALIDPTGNLKTSLTIDEESPTKIEVYIHRAMCASASTRALGSNFDGYVRITIFEKGQMIARAQMDYKGEPSPETVQKIYDTLIQKLQWQGLVTKRRDEA